MKDNIQVVPTEGGWLVCASSAATPMAFQSGADAVRDAHALAERLAGAGRHAIVLIYDQAGVLAGTDLYAAASVVGGALA